MRCSFRPSELGRPLVRRYYPMAKGEKPGFQDLLECVPSHGSACGGGTESFLLRKIDQKLTALRAQMRARAGRVHFFPQQLVPRYAEPRGNCLYVYVHMMQAANPWVAAVQCRGTEWSCGEIVRVRERAGGKNEVAWKGSDSRAGAPGLCHKSRFFVTEPRPSWMMPFQRST